MHRATGICLKMGFRLVEQVAFLHFAPFFWYFLMIFQSFAVLSVFSFTLKNLQIRQQYGKKMTYFSRVHPMAPAPKS